VFVKGNLIVCNGLGANLMKPNGSWLKPNVFVKSNEKEPKKPKL
jgi:hypothetical protein